MADADLPKPDGAPVSGTEARPTRLPRTFRLSRGPRKHLPAFGGRQVGTSIGYDSSLSAFGYYGHPEAHRLADYERAITTDETISAAFEFIRLSMLAALGPYQNENPEHQAFVTEVLACMKGSHRQTLGELIWTSMWAGFAVTEAVWKPFESSRWGPRIGIERLVTYNSRTIHIEVDRKGCLNEGAPSLLNSAYHSGIWQDQIGVGGARVQLPLNKVCLVTRGKRYGNYYGTSALKAIYKNWRLKDAVLVSWNVALDRYGTPVIWVIVPRAGTGKQTTDSTTGEVREELLADQVAEAVGGIPQGTALVLEQPNPEDKIQIGTVGTSNNFGDSFQQAISYFNAAVYRGLLLPQLLLSEGKSFGGGSVAAVHFEVFKLLVAAMYDDVVEPFVEQVIGRLLAWNFGEEAARNPGRFEMVPYDAPTAEIMAQIFDILIAAGILSNTDPGDVNLVRVKTGLDRLDPEAVEALVSQNLAKLDAELARAMPAPAGAGTGSGAPPGRPPMPNYSRAPATRAKAAGRTEPGKDLRERKRGRLGS